MTAAKASVCAIAAIMVTAATAAAQARPPDSDHVGEAFQFHRITDDVYHAIGTGSMVVGANAAIVINETDVLVVDSHISPAAASVLLDELRQITSKPVRYVVNTHHHFDHAHGNQIYRESVEIIGHEFTRDKLASGASVRGRSYERFLGSLPHQIADLKARLDTTRESESRAALERQIRIQENYKLATDAVRPVSPTITMNQRMTLIRGGRLIHLEFLGRGHTGGDIVVYLPAERVLITGDLLTAGIPYMGDGYVPDWIETLERLKRLQFDVVLPGHGQAFRERERIDYLQSYFADFWSQVVSLHRAGVPAPEAAAQIDMRSHANHFPNIRTIGVDIDAVLGAYEVLSGAR